MNEIARIEQPKARGLTAVMAEKFQMAPDKFVEAIKSTVIKGNVNEGQLAAFLMVAHEYGLNPLTKEVYAFPSNGGIQPIVSVDGWMKLINQHPQFDGMEFTDHVDDDGKLDAITCRIFRKDRSHPTEATEYMAECRRDTDPWRKWSRRMLRHKAAIQCARYAFSFAGIMDDDDFERMRDVTPTVPLAQRLEQARTATQEPQDKREGFDADYVARETETRVSETEFEEAESEAANDALAEGDGAPSSQNPPSPSPLIECCRKLLGIAVDPLFETPQQRRTALEKAKDQWKANLPEADHRTLKSIVASADAVIKGDTSHESAVLFFSECLECSEDDLK